MLPGIKVFIPTANSILFISFSLYSYKLGLNSQVIFFVIIKQIIDKKKGFQSEHSVGSDRNDQPGFWALITEQIDTGGAGRRARSFASSRKEAAKPAADRAWPDSESTNAPLSTSGTRYRISSSDFSWSGESSESTAHTQQHEAKVTWLTGKQANGATQTC